MKNFLFKLSLLTSAILSCSVAMAQQAVETAQVLPTIEVTAQQGTKYETNVVTTEVKNESTETDLRGLLKEEPAIDFGAGNGASQYISIRGMGQNSIDLKVDNAYSDAQVLYHQGRLLLDPALVKIVAVQKGAGSASAGIGATNGAIVAKTIDAQDLLKNSDRDYGAKISAGYASNDEHSYGVTAFGRAGAFDLLASYNVVNQNNYKGGKGYVSPVDGGDEVKYSALDKSSYLIKAGLNLDNHRFVLSHFNDMNKGVRTIREEMESFNGQDPQYRELSTENTNLEWQATNLAFASRADANVYRMKTTRESADDSQSNYAARVAGKNTTSSEAIGANLNFDSNVGESTVLKYGVNYRYQTAKPNTRNSNLIVDQEKTDVGVYAELIGKVGDFTLTTGLRYDTFDFKAMNGKEVSADALNPSVGIIWEPVENLSLSAVHNYATRSPRMVDSLLSHGARGIVSVADGLEPERAKNTEIGFNYDNGTFSVKGSYFWQRIDNLLNSGSVARHAVGGVEYSRGIDNVGYGRNKGFELSTAYQWNGLKVHAGVAESEPQFYTEGDATFNTASYAARVGRTWTAGLAYRFDQPNLEIGVNHRNVETTYGSSAWMRHQGTAPRQNNIYEKRPGYHFTDVYANWKPLNNDKLNINFAINNITDELYRPHTQGTNATALHGAGRDYRIGFNYTF